MISRNSRDLLIIDLNESILLQNLTNTELTAASRTIKAKLPKMLDS